MENATRTIFGASVVSDLVMNRPHQYIATLNEILGINANLTPTTSERNSVKLWTIGTRGHQSLAGTNGQVLLKPIQHKARHANVYGKAPFVLRQANNDITATDRAKYALRKEEIIGGVAYVAYYGRRMDFTNTVTQLQLVTVDNGVETITDYVPSADDLNPTPPTTTNTGTNVINGQYVQASTRVQIGMTDDEAAEFRNVCTILYGDEAYATVSEILVCSAVDRSITITDQSTGNSFSMNEALGVQAYSHVPSLEALSLTNEGFTMTLDLGVREPMFNVTVVSVNP